MAVRLLKETIRFERQEAAAQDRAVVEGSVPLPGGLREAAKVLLAGASVAVQRVEPMQDRAGVSGRASFRVLYTQGEPDKVQAIEAGADFTHVMDVPGARAQGVCQVTAQVERVEARTAGGQLNLKAIVILDARATAVQPLEVVTGLADAPGMEMDTQEIALRRTAARGSEEVMLREELELPADLPIRETLFAVGETRVEAVTGGAGRAGIVGTVRLEVCHASEDPERPLIVTRHEIPFERAVDLAGEDGGELTGEAVVRDVAVASQGNGEEGRILRAEVVLGLSARADCVERMTILRDAYTTEGEALVLTRSEVVCRAEETRTHDEEACRCMLTLPEGAGPVRQVLFASVTPTVASRRQAGSRLAVEGTLAVRLVVMPAEDSAPVAVTLEEPFRQTFAAEAAEDDTVSLTAAEAEASVLAGGRMELRCVLRLDAEGRRSVPVTVVTDVQSAAAPPDDPGIVLYFIQPGESLWDIAKRYRVAAGEITHLNPDLPAELHPGQSMVVWRRPPDAAAWSRGAT